MATFLGGPKAGQTYYLLVVVALIKTAESLGMSTSLNEELGKKSFGFGDNEKMQSEKYTEAKIFHGKELALCILKYY